MLKPFHHTLVSDHGVVNSVGFDVQGYRLRQLSGGSLDPGFDPTLPATKTFMFELTDSDLLAVSIKVSSHANGIPLGHVVHVDGPEIFFRDLETRELAITFVVPSNVFQHHPVAQRSSPLL